MPRDFLKWQALFVIGWFYNIYKRQRAASFSEAVTMSAFEEEEDAGCVCKVSGIKSLKGTEIFSLKHLLASKQDILEQTYQKHVWVI